MRKVLITGGAGFIGYHLAKKLTERSVQVDILDSLDRGVADEEFHDLTESENVRFFERNLIRGSFLDEIDNDYDYIYHFAAIIGVANVLNRAYSVLRDNVTMLDSMLDVAAKQKQLSRFVFTSTSEVYAGTLQYFDLPIPTPESTPLAVTDLSGPRTSYMLSKIYGEAMCQHSGIPFTILRPHNVYGPRMGMAHVIPELLKRAYTSVDAECLDVYSPDHTRTFCFIDDAIEIVLRSSQEKQCENQTLNLGTQEPEISMRKIAQIVLETVGRDLKINDLAPTEGSPSRRCPDMSKTNALIDFYSRVSLKEGIEKTFRWYRENVFDGSTISAQ